MSAQAERLEKEWKAWSCGHEEGHRSGAPWCVDCVLAMTKRIKILERELRWLVNPNSWHEIKRVRKIQRMVRRR